MEKISIRGLTLNKIAQVYIDYQGFSCHGGTKAQRKLYTVRKYKIVHIFIDNQLVRPLRRKGTKKIAHYTII